MRPIPKNHAHGYNLTHDGKFRFPSRYCTIAPRVENFLKHTPKLCTFNGG